MRSQLPRFAILRRFCAMDQTDRSVHRYDCNFLQFYHHGPLVPFARNFGTIVVDCYIKATRERERRRQFSKRAKGGFIPRGFHRRVPRKISRMLLSVGGLPDAEFELKYIVPEQRRDAHRYLPILL